MDPKTKYLICLWRCAKIGLKVYILNGNKEAKKKKKMFTCHKWRQLGISSVIFQLYYLLVLVQFFFIFMSKILTPDRSLVVSLTKQIYILAKGNPEIWYGSLHACVSSWGLEIRRNPDRCATGADMARACCTLTVHKQLFEIVAINVKQLEDS